MLRQVKKALAPAWLACRTKYPAQLCHLRYFTALPKLKLGDTVRVSLNDYGELSRTFSAKDIESYAKLTGDHNPIHLDKEAAAKSRFGKPIAHGMLTASLIGTLFGTHLPGCIYVSQTLRFTAPVFVGDTVTCRITITSIAKPKNVVTCSTECSNQKGDKVIDGEARVLVPDLA